jgi:adenine-specific DNA methylase
MTDRPRLIEVAFPLRQASLDSVHEKNVRHGHISTLHIWPARRPLAACRAALLATLLPDPGTAPARKQLVEKIGGRVVNENGKPRTEGGVLHWGREESPDMEWFRSEIRKVYGRAPRVLDPFAGGGAIPLEAMRLGCEATAVDVNPVAWFILKCTLEYPQKLAGQTRPLPDFVREWPDFVEEFRRSVGEGTKKRGGERGQGSLFALPEANLAWHVRAWGRWVLEKARQELARFYPVVDGKPTVAYLWARTVKCKNCRATIPLLKTRWLCKKKDGSKRVLLTMAVNEKRDGVTFGVQTNVPMPKGSGAQKRKQDKELGGGTMSRSGAKCPCCGTLVPMEDLRLEGRAGRLETVMAAVVFDGLTGKDYRLPRTDELLRAQQAVSELDRVFGRVPFGIPAEPLADKDALGIRVPLYGINEWHKLFTPTQLVALGTFVKQTHSAREALREGGYSAEWVEAISAYLALAIDRIADRGSSICHWDIGYEKVANTFTAFRLPISWDFAETCVVSDTTGSYSGQLEWIAQVVTHASQAAQGKPSVSHQSAKRVLPDREPVDLIITDPPYYDAIPYSDLMDFFYIWLRRSTNRLNPALDDAFREPLGPKWNHQENDGELIDDASRHGGNLARSRAVYEEGMFHAFQACAQSLLPSGRLVVVFAHKQPNAWETLVSAIIRAGFVVDASWPIQTEMGNRTRALTSAALSSSVWLVCKKRPATARPGWDNVVLNEMRTNIYQRLRDFWDAGIRGPDFVWAATGPALEAYSKHPIVKKAERPGELMSVADFLRAVRRIVVDFVVGRVLSKGAEGPQTTGLDDVTTYYLLHRHAFGTEEAPAGACILYAVSCGLSDDDLVQRFDLIARTGGKSATNEEEEEENQDSDTDETSDEATGSGSRVRLKTWKQRTRKTLGEDERGPAPMIDQVHRLLQLWAAGEEIRVNDFLERRGLIRNALFAQLLQALIELADAGSEERAKLESLSNHLQGRSPPSAQKELPFPE